MYIFRDIPLVGQGPAVAITITLMVACIAGLALGKKVRTFLSLGIAIALAFGVYVYITYLAHIIPDKLPWTLYAAGIVPAFILIRLFLVKGHKVLMAILLVVSLLCALVTVNNHFSMYPTVGDLDPTPRAQVLSLEEFNKLTAAPEINGRPVGAQVTVPIPGTTSDFSGRDAIAYVPPAYFDNKTEPLPVLVLMAGNPGSPDDWFRTGVVQKAADEFQQQHSGRSPIVVSVDGTGSYTGNPACVDGSRGKVQTYLDTDVPAAIKSTFKVNPDQEKWTIGGLSYGGTCSFQVVTNNPTAYGSFLNISGQAHPVLDNHANTVERIFGGSEQAFQKVDPEAILTRASKNPSQAEQLARLQGVFAAGERDSESTKALTHLNDLSQKIGMTTRFEPVPGGHDFQAWRSGLEDNFAWVAQRGGINE